MKESAQCPRKAETARKFFMGRNRDGGDEVAERRGLERPPLPFIWSRRIRAYWGSIIWGKERGSAGLRDGRWCEEGSLPNSPRERKHPYERTRP